MDKKTHTSNNSIITFLHILGALLVLCGHWYVLRGLKAPDILGMELHVFGVRLLFLISGYLSYVSIRRHGNSIKDFIIKKIIRLLPPLWVCLFLITVVLVFFTERRDIYLNGAVKYFFSNAILIPKHEIIGVFESNPYPKAINGSLWSLPVEMFCYVTVPILVGFCQHICEKYSVIIYKILLFSGILVFQICVCSHVLSKAPISEDYIISIIEVIVWFLVGEFVSTIDNRMIIRIAILICGVILFLWPNFQNFILPYFVGLLFDEMVFWGYKKPFDSFPPIIDVCYGMYLYGFPLQQLIIYIFMVKGNYEIGNAFLFGLSLLLDVLMGVLSYFAVEQPLSKWLKSKQDDKLSIEK